MAAFPGSGAGRGRRAEIALTAIGAMAGAVLFLILETNLFLFVMNANVNVNEHVYLAASVLYQRYSLYKDFSFPQMPYLPVILGCLFKITGATHYLLCGRLAAFFFANFAGLMVFLLGRRFTRNYAASVMFTVLFLASPGVMAAMKECSNYIAPIPFALLGLYLFLSAMTGPRQSSLLLLASGAAIAFAAGLKLFYVFLAPPACLLILLYPGFGDFRSRLKNAVLPFTLGLLAGSTGPIYYLVTRFQPFIFNNLLVNIDKGYQAALGVNVGVTVQERILILLKSPDNRLLLSAAAFAALAAGASLVLRWRKIGPVARWEFTLVLFSAGFSIMPLYFTAMVYEQYVAMPVTFAIVLIAYACKLVDFGKVFLYLALLVLTLRLLSGEAAKCFELDAWPWNYSEWTVTKFHQNARQMKKIADTYTSNNLMATPFPLHALEGGFDFYKEFAQGPFLYSIGDLVRESGDYDCPVYTSPTRVKNLLEQNHPGSVLFQPFRNMQPFKDYAVLHGFKKVKLDSDQIVVFYVRPDK